MKSTISKSSREIPELKNMKSGQSDAEVIYEEPHNFHFPKNQIDFGWIYKNRNLATSMGALTE